MELRKTPINTKVVNLARETYTLRTEIQEILFRLQADMIQIAELAEAGELALRDDALSETLVWGLRFAQRLEAELQDRGGLPYKPAA